MTTLKPNSGFSAAIACATGVATPAVLLATLAAVPAGAAEAPIAPEEFLQVEWGRVILSNTADLKWGRGELRLEAEPNEVSDLVLVTQKVDAHQLPRDLRQWRERRVRLINRDGSDCISTITGFQIVGVPQSEEWWKHVYRDGGHSDRRFRPMIRDGWAHSDRVVAATISGSCRHAYWARLASLPVPEIAAVNTVQERRLVEEATAAFQSTPEYRARQTQYQSQSQSGSRQETWWDEFGGTRDGIVEASFPDLRLLSIEGFGKREFHAGLWTIWEVHGEREDPHLTLRLLVEEPQIRDLYISVAQVIRFKDRHGLIYFYFSGHGRGVMRETTARAVIDEPRLSLPRHL